MDHKQDTSLSFIDMLLNVLCIMVFCFVLTLPLVQVTKSKSEESVKPNAEFIISLQWDYDSDLDLWVQDPNGAKVYFKHRMDGAMHLYFDNRGAIDSKVVLPDGTVTFLNHYEEVVTLRGFVPGEYVVNVHAYNPKDADHNPVPVGQPIEVPFNVTITKLNPVVKQVYQGSYKIQKAWQEITTVKFTIDKDGNVLSINPNPPQMSMVKGEIQ